MSKHRYILEPYKGKSTRYTCPSCEEKRSFTLYIDTETGEHIAPSVGRCDHENYCGHHYTPKQYFEDNNIKSKKENTIYQYKDEIRFEFEYSETVKDAVKKINGCKYDATAKQWHIENSVITEQIRDFSKEYSFNIIEYTPPEPVIKKQVSFIPFEVFKQSLKDHDENNFVKFLVSLFGVEVTSELISKYFIGTSKLWNGATVFWQIDLSGKIRTGKIMLYSPATGKRVKEPYKHINWVHSVLKLPEFNLQQCLFGEHLLQDKTKPVAIVESEKTAIIASVYLPEFIWLAVGSLKEFKAEKCQALKGRKVVLFPDLNGFEKWNDKANELSNLATFTVSDLLERKATETEKQQGLDLADYLIRFDYKAFQPQEQTEHQQQQIEQLQPEFEQVQELQPVKKVTILTEPEQILSEQPTVIKQLIEAKHYEPNKQTYHFSKPETGKPESWEQELSELEKFFKRTELPVTEIKTSEGTITDIHIFINCNLTTAKAQNGNHTYLPYLYRLRELNQILLKSNN